MPIRNLISPRHLAFGRGKGDLKTGSGFPSGPQASQLQSTWGPPYLVDCNYSLSKAEASWAAVLMAAVCLAAWVDQPEWQAPAYPQASALARGLTPWHSCHNLRLQLSHVGLRSHAGSQVRDVWAEPSSTVYATLSRGGSAR